MDLRNAGGLRTAIVPLAALSLLASSTGCTFVSRAGEYNGLPGEHGRPVEFYSATNVGMTLLFFLPVAGHPTVPDTLSALTAKVKEEGGTNVRIVSTGTMYLWYLYFPISLIIHPAVATVTADAEFLGPPGVEKGAGKDAKGSTDSKTGSSSSTSTRRPRPATEAEPKPARARTNEAEPADDDVPEKEND